MKSSIVTINTIENKLHYTFRTPALLDQAFTRKSYAMENGGADNEILEFIGDKALDLAVIRILMERFGHLPGERSEYFETDCDEGRFTELKRKLVEKKALAESMERLGFHSLLRMGCGDVLRNVAEQDSVKEDLFEAIIGAVALDADWNPDILARVIRQMIDFDRFFAEEETARVDYVSTLQIWAQKRGKNVVYQYAETDGGFLCTVLCDGLPEVNGFGSGHAKARMSAAEKMCSLLDFSEPERSLLDEIGSIRPELSINQLNELWQKKLIPEPSYRFTEEKSALGTSIWSCECSLPGEFPGFSGTASAKKDAQREAAAKMLRFLTKEE